LWKEGSNSRPLVRSAIKGSKRYLLEKIDSLEKILRNEKSVTSSNRVNIAHEDILHLNAYIGGKCK
jgi:hypothetical protein